MHGMHAAPGDFERRCKHLGKAVVVQQEGSNLPQRRLPDAHCWLQPRLPELPPHKALKKRSRQGRSIVRAITCCCISCCISGSISATWHSAAERERSRTGKGELVWSSTNACMHLGVIGRQRLLIAGFYNGHLDAHLRAEEVRAAQPSLQLGMVSMFRVVGNQCKFVSPEGCSLYPTSTAACVHVRARRMQQKFSAKRLFPSDRDSSMVQGRTSAASGSWQQRRPRTTARTSRRTSGCVCVVPTTCQRQQGPRRALLHISS